ncbi:NifU family protein [Gemella sanguinis]|mgnify:FL=1|uniref:NifU family protein n=1 Tax=Gemella sanguinis TaxID=84135 RepID=UPI0028D8C290|nr:NifU family protein [Gemella sanguinis]
MSKEYYETISKIKIELEKIRPKLNMDGGDIEFVNFKDGILKLRFKGECAHCELSHITMKFAIEKNILEKIPEVKKVTEVKMSVI